MRSGEKPLSTVDGIYKQDHQYVTEAGNRAAYDAIVELQYFFPNVEVNADNYDYMLGIYLLGQNLGKLKR